MVFKEQLSNKDFNSATISHQNPRLARAASIALVRVRRCRAAAPRPADVGHHWSTRAPHGVDWAHRTCAAYPLPPAVVRRGAHISRGLPSPHHSELGTLNATDVLSPRLSLPEAKVRYRLVMIQIVFCYLV